MQRVVLACAGALALLAACLFHPAAAVADPPSCQQYDAYGICVVKAQQAGNGGISTQPVSAGRGDDGGAAAQSPCSLEPEGVAVPCQSGDAWWSQGMQCYTQPLNEQPPKDSPEWAGHTNGAIYSCTFYTGGRSFPGTNGYTFWSATPPAGPATAVDPVQLAQQAVRTLIIPSPTTGRYPAGTMQDGTPFAVVGAYTWFWTDPGTYRPLTARADAGGVWAQVSVTPTALTFTPGDGAAAASCRGPGVAWRQGDGVWAASPAGCDYRYPHSSIHQYGQQVTATYGIRWSVTWTSSTGASGVLPGLTTTSNATFAVAEVESVVIR
jgi:hypothetical protein